MKLHVAADDRTGAFETAAALADHGLGPVPVTVWPDTSSAASPPPVAVVVDLGSRHLSPSAAAARAVAVEPGSRAAHKIDSTLRGNWAEELVARAHSRPVLLVPALPGLGRTCVGGVVHDHGRPVNEGAAGSDVRRRVMSARPAETLRAASDDPVPVAELATIDAVGDWLAAPVGVAVADAVHDEDIVAIVDAWWPNPDVVLAGTAAVIGAAGAHLAADEPDEPDDGAGGTVDAPAGARPGPVLVVCGSLHPMARAQLDEAERRSLHVTTLVDEITVRTLTSAGRLALVTEIPPGDVDAPYAVAAATTLARGVHDVLSRVDLGALVLIGGDTAAAVIGDAAVLAHRSIAPGTPLVTVEGIDVPVITRSGGFGSEHALVDLLDRVLPSVLAESVPRPDAPVVIANDAP